MKPDESATGSKFPIIFEYPKALLNNDCEWADGVANSAPAVATAHNP